MVINCSNILTFTLKLPIVVMNITYQTTYIYARSVSQAVRQSGSPAVSQSDSQSVSQIVSQSGSQPVRQTVSQSGSQSVS